MLVGSHTLDISKRLACFEGETGSGFRKNKEFHSRIHLFQLWIIYKLLPVFSINKRPTKRVSNPKTRHTLEFALPLPASTSTNQQVQDKAKVRETIFKLRAEGLSYREIANVVGLHFTRIRQILKAANGNGRRTIWDVFSNRANRAFSDAHSLNRTVIYIDLKKLIPLLLFKSLQVHKLTKTLLNPGFLFCVDI